MKKRPIKRKAPKPGKSKEIKTVKKMPRRNRKNVSVTLSDEATKMGHNLARERGLPFARFVEDLIRRELRKIGVLPPEGGQQSCDQQ